MSVSVFFLEILSNLKIVEMETGKLAWSGLRGREMVVGQEVWAITLIVRERREKCSVQGVMVDRAILPVREQGP